MPPTNIALPHEGLTYRFPFDTEKRTYPVFDPIAQKAFDANYDGEEDVNGLTTYRFSQNVGYDADGKLVEPVKYSSLLDDDADAEVTARAALWGIPGEPDEPITMTRYYAAQRTFWVDPVSGTIVKKEDHGYHYYAREPLKPEVTFVDYKVTSNEETVETPGRERAGTSATGWRCGGASCRSPSPRSDWSRSSAARCWDRSACARSPRSSTRDSTKPITASSTPRGYKCPGAEAKTEKLPASRPTDLPPDRPV